MLKNIRLHIEKDEKIQAELDEKLAKQIIKTHSSNINVFQRNIPSLLPMVQNIDLANYSVFVNKYAENNIVDYGMGRTFYGFHPEKEVLEQLSRVEQHCLEVEFQKQLTSAEGASHSASNLEQLRAVTLRNQQSPLPYEIECLVILGCGLGIHLSHLLKRHKIKNLLIYEPELQYFQCSALATSWQEIFTLAKEHDTSIFLQLEKDGRELLKDINELIEHCAISSFHLYKHYNHPVFDSIQKDLSERSWTSIQNNGFNIKSKESYLEFLPHWTPDVDLATHSLLTAPNDKLTHNLNAFKKYFPEIYNQYKEYTPKNWLPIANSEGEVNLIKIDSLNTWYGDSPKFDCSLNFENFNEQPNKDGLVLGYRGNKLAHYIHYQFVKETEELLKQAEEDVGALPNIVPSVIMFGLGVGYQLEKLLDEHTVEKLFICEPNPDFFYASLFAIDWQNIFETVEKSGSRIYLNIGDDGTNLFRDLLRQFYAIGPYILNSTYFYQSYYNASLNSAISQLREQLQVVIAMGEYFDHAYYGIAHTKEGMRRKIPVLVANPATKLSYEDKEVPIFIVGNGPSLDTSIDAIKEWQGQAIIVSCGTTLQALHRHGITPDFHAEIEQNRSTFDWAVLIGDLDYLKNITLISCNGIHPDTCDLYKDVMIAFKEGESSTESALNILGRENFETLKNAFPTVSNFVCDLFSTLGFSSIYLIGVDLGFVNVKHHHSKSSGYYQKDGKETYDYANSANTSLIVPGNFRPRVNTKHEFKVSRQIIEQVTGAKPKGQEFYNCSDGAKINGALPIKPEELLIIATELQKAQTILKLKTTIFSINHIDDYAKKFKQTFSNDLLVEELKTFETLLGQEIVSKTDIDHIINKQKEMLFASYRNGMSLLFYYLYGTVNYANAVLTKMTNCNVASTNIQKTQHLTTDIWLNTIGQIRAIVDNSDPVDFDVSNYRVHWREAALLAAKYDQEKLLIITDSPGFKKVIEYSIKKIYPWFIHVQILSLSESLTYQEIPEYSLYFTEPLSQTTLIRGRINTLIMMSEIDNGADYSSGVSHLIIPNFSSDTILSNKLLSTHVALSCCLSTKSPLILSKFITSDLTNFNDTDLNIPIEGYQAYDYTRHICIYPKNTFSDYQQVSNSGTRGKKYLSRLKMNDLVQKKVTNDELENQKSKQLGIIGIAINS